MGTFYVTIEIGDPQGQQFEELQALVDSGSTTTVVPTSALRRMCVTPARRETFEFADGRRMDMDGGADVCFEKDVRHAGSS